MSVLLEDCLQTAMKNISDSLKFDVQKKYKEAYVQYLGSIIFILNTLLTDSTNKDIECLVSDASRKLIKLVDECLNRINSIMDLLEKPTVRVIPEVIDINPSVVSLDQTSITQCSFQSQRPSSKSLSPIEEAYQKNQKLMAVYQAKMFNANPLKISNLRLELSRRLTENIEVAKAQQEALNNQRKQNELQMQKQENKLSTPATRLSIEEQILYQKIINFEQNRSWPVKLRQKLDKPLKERTATLIVEDIFRVPDHPLTHQFMQYQKILLGKIKPLLTHIELDSVHNSFSFNELKGLNITCKPIEPLQTTDSLLLSSESQKDLKFLEIETAEDAANSSELFNSYFTAPRRNPYKNDIIRQLDDICQLIHSYMNSLVSMFNAVFQVKDFDVKDLWFVAIGKSFHHQLWNDIQTLFRLVNQEEEHRLQAAIKKQAVPQNIYPDDIVKELKKLTAEVNPHLKIQHLVNALYGLGHISSDNAISADDLLRSLSNAIVLTNLPELLADCQLMEKFILESHRVGEEGYCLVTLQVALYSLIASINDK